MDTTTNGTALSVVNLAKVEAALVGGDLGKLSTEERLHYYRNVCESVGLNPLTRPFDYLTLQGKTILYARKDATDQLRKLHKISVSIVGREMTEGVYTVTARATTPDGRTDEDVGSVVIANLKGEALANAQMKAHTKAKRRVTLSIVGLGILDESELDTVSGAQRFEEPATPSASMSNAAHEKVAEFLTAIADAPTVADLQRVGEALAKEPGPVKEAVRGDYSTRMKALKSAEKNRTPGEEG